MTAKEFLNQGRNIEAEIKQLRGLKRRAYDMATSTVVPTDKPPGAGRGGGDVMAAYAQYQDEIEEAIARLFHTQQDILAIIGRLPNAKYRELLIARYLEGKKWEEIAEDMDCSYQNAAQFLHSKALSAVSKLLDCF